MEREAPSRTDIDGQVVQMLWFGVPLGPIERLSIRSFLDNGHSLHLYTYSDLRDVPHGAVVHDGSDILQRSEFERLRKRGVRPAVIADLFRYKLLQQRGGWWVDADVVCLRSFAGLPDISLGRQDDRTINNAVLRLPPNHRICHDMIDRCVRPNRWRTGDGPTGRRSKVRRALLRQGLESVDWGATGPDGLTIAATKHFPFDETLEPEVFYPVKWQDWRTLFEPGELKVSHATRAVHLWNEKRRESNAHWANGSPIDTLMRRFAVDS
jgi:hypothetical protein